MATAKYLLAIIIKFPLTYPNNAPFSSELLAGMEYNPAGHFILASFSIISSYGLYPVTFEIKAGSCNKNKN